MRIQRPTISQPTITQPVITEMSSLTGDGASITGSFSGSFVGELTGPTSASFAADITAASSSLASDIVANSSSLATSITGVQSNLDSVSSSLATDITGVQSNLDTASGSLAGRIATIEGDNATQTELDAVSSSLATSITSTNSDVTSLEGLVQGVRAYTGSLKQAISVSGTDLTILGDLTVQGTQTAIDSATLNVADLNITVASGSADAAAANGAGLTVDGASATLTYASTGDKWVFNKVVDVPTSGLLIDGTAVTATATELNYVDGVTSNIQTQLNDKLDTDNALINVGGFNQLTFKDLAGRINGSSNLTFDPFSFDLTHANGTAKLNGGIDVNSSVFTVSTAGDVKADSLGVGTAASGTTGEIRATGDITAYYSSDERLKENFKTLDGALDKVNQLNGYEFDWKDGIEDVVSKKGHDIGVKAQEVQALYPELVHERDNGYLAVDYVKLTAVLLQAVKELSAKVDELSK